MTASDRGMSTPRRHSVGLQWREKQERSRNAFDVTAIRGVSIDLRRHVEVHERESLNARSNQPLSQAIPYVPDFASYWGKSVLSSLVFRVSVHVVLNDVDRHLVHPLEARWNSVHPCI